MSTNAISPEESDAQIRPRTIDLGTDAEGATHIYRTGTETVHVVTADGRREHVEHIGDRHVDEWVGYVGQERGWATKRYGGGLLGMVDDLVAALDE